MLPRRLPPPLSLPPSPAPRTTAVVCDITAGAQSCALLCPSAVSIDLVEHLTQSGVLRQRSGGGGVLGVALSCVLVATICTMQQDVTEKHEVWS